MTEKNHKNQDNSSTEASSIVKKIFSNFNKNKFCPKTLSFLLAIFFVITGIIITLLFQSIKHHYEVAIIKKHFNNFYHDFDNDYIGLDNEDDDFQKELLGMQKRINRTFNHHRQFFDQNNPVQNFPNNDFKASNSSNVKIHEDDKNFYYELVFFGFTKDEINVEIKDKILTFQANKKSIEHLDNSKKTEEIKQQNTSSFSYSFLLSNYNIEKAADITKLDDKIIVKIAKK